MKSKKSLTIILVRTGTTVSSNAQSDSSTDRFARELPNSVTSLIQLPINIDYNYGYDPLDENRISVSLEPIVPARLSPNWNIVIRVVAPFWTQSDITSEEECETDLRDFNKRTFFVPKSKGLVVGFGPVVGFLTATYDLTGYGKWTLRPTAVALIQTKKVITGILSNHSWPIARESDRAEVNNTFVQPFFIMNFTGGWSISLTSEIVYDWKSESTNGSVFAWGQRPVIPLSSVNTSEFGLSITA